MSNSLVTKVLVSVEALVYLQACSRVPPLTCVTNSCDGKFDVPDCNWIPYGGMRVSTGARQGASIHLMAVAKTDLGPLSAGTV